MRYESTTYEVRGAGGWITLNRPDKKNAVDLTVIDEVGHALISAASNPNVRAVVITGAGTAFCSGADLTSVSEAVSDDGSGDRDSILHFLKRFEELLRTIRTLPKPVIAAINGVTCAGGIETIACCDLNIAVESATFSDAHARWGFMPGLGGGRELARAVGTFKAKEMMFTADNYSATQMAAAGLVNHVVSDGQLVNFVDGVVSKLALRSPRGLARMKQMINDGMDMPWDVAARYEMLCLEAQLHSRDFVEGLAAFQEHRQPAFPRMRHPGMVRARED